MHLPEPVLPTFQAWDNGDGIIIQRPIPVKDAMPGAMPGAGGAGAFDIPQGL